jgi:sec-independent protein translocase protein TatA
MLGFHWLELLVILPLIALILGPRRLPALGSALGRALRSFREGVADLQEESGLAELRHGFRKGIADLKAETGVDEMRRDVRQGLAGLRHESGLDEVRRELSGLERPPR